jgi:hypothetical protein
MKHAIFKLFMNRLKKVRQMSSASFILTSYRRGAGGRLSLTCSAHAVLSTIVQNNIYP